MINLSIYSKALFSLSESDSFTILSSIIVSVVSILSFSGFSQKIKQTIPMTKVIIKELIIMFSPLIKIVEYSLKCQFL